MNSLYKSRSAWARGPCTAGPRDLLRMRNWMPALSITRAINPSSASTSLTSVPLPTPPMDGCKNASAGVSNTSTEHVAALAYIA